LLALVMVSSITNPVVAFGQEQSPPGPSSFEIPAEQPLSEQSPALPAPAVTHPSVERPPVPDPPRHISLPATGSQVPASAAWRVTALTLAAGRKLERPSASRLFDAVYGDTLLAVLGACYRSGLKVEALNSTAGEVLAALPGSNVRIVVTLAQTAPGKTRVAAGCHSGTGESARQTIDLLLQTCAETLTKQERI
jgi:hypothetical protein